MHVILLKDIQKVGRKFEVVQVSNGYAANFLLPQRLAEVATPTRIAELDKRREKLHAVEDARRADLVEKLTTLSDASITVVAKADDKGHLYKKIHASDIVSALKDELEISLDESSILLDEAIHEVGEHTINVAVGSKKTTFVLSVVTG